jgi:hypothetical protein
VQTFTSPGADMSTGLSAGSPAPDGSTVLNVWTSQQDGDTVTSVSSQLVKLDAAGHVVWQQALVPGVFSTPDPRDCSTLITGTIPGGSTDLLGKTVACGSPSCPFVARIDAGGSLGWVKTYDFGADGWVIPSVAGILADGRIALAGPFERTIDLGNGPLSAPSSSCGVFAALLSPAGDALWSRQPFTRAGVPLWMDASAVVSPAGDITVAANVEGTVDFGQGPIGSTGPLVTCGLAIASYDATGELRFGKAIFSEGETWAPNLALSTAGHLIVAQDLAGATDFGGGPIGSTGPLMTAVVAFDAGGQYLWSTGLGSEGNAGLAVDAAAHVWVGLGSNIAELDSAGALIAMRSIGGSGYRWEGVIGFAPGGAPVIAGAFEGTLDLGTGTRTAQSQQDAFIAALAP